MFYRGGALGIRPVNQALTKHIHSQAVSIECDGEYVLDSEDVPDGIAIRVLIVKETHLGFPNRQRPQSWALECYLCDRVGEHIKAFHIPDHRLYLVTGWDLSDYHGLPRL
jgi:hypothetical protein